MLNSTINSIIMNFFPTKRCFATVTTDNKYHIFLLDINECLPTNDCMQKCDNSVGSYNCSCDEYFKTDPTDWRKCVGKWFISKD